VVSYVANYVNQILDFDPYKVNPMPLVPSPSDPAPAKRQKAYVGTSNLSFGSCGIQADFFDSKAMLAAVGQADFGTEEFSGSSCGKCLHVKGPTGQVEVRVVSRCTGRCDTDGKGNTIMLSVGAMQRVSAGGPGHDGLSDIEWKFVECGSTAAQNEIDQAPNGNTVSTPSTVTTSKLKQVAQLTYMKVAYGSCGLPVDFGTELAAAIGYEDFGRTEFKGAACQKCIKVKGKDGEITVPVRSRCEGICDEPKTVNAENAIQLSRKAIEAVDKKGPNQDSIVEIEWSFTECVGSTTTTTTTSTSSTAGNSFSGGILNGDQ
jgi:hypothetical protein